MNLTELLKENGADLGWLKTDHLTADQAALMNKAASACQAFLTAVSRNQPSCLILTSVPTQNSTGYGVGKTTLAHLVHTLNCRICQLDDGRLVLYRHGTMLAASDLMAVLDDRDSSAEIFVADCGNLLVIDDVGREGALRYEDRDPIVQQTMRKQRYYDIVRACQAHGVSILLTTNFTSVHLVNHLGGTTWSRLNMMNFRSVNLSGIPDYRIMHSRGEK